MYKKIILLLALFIVSSKTVFAVTEADSLALVALYDSTNGDEWISNDNWNSGPVEAWYGVHVSGNRVTELNLGYNNLEGTFPTSISNLTGLEYLYLNSNQLTGSIPSSIGNLTSLEYLDLKYNQLTGPIPAEIWDLTSLRVLLLDNNQLTGSIPQEIGNLTSLEWLYLYENQLTGSIPTEIGNLTSLRWLLLCCNQLTGSIPTEIGNLTSLVNLFLNDNSFVSLPSLSELSSLEVLRIQNNKFTFEDIEPNVEVPSSEFTYSPQDSVGEPQDTIIHADSSFSMSISIGGDSNQYQWKRDGSIIPGATDSSYTISSAEPGDSGSYICEITNTVATELTLYSKPVNVAVNTSGVSDDLLTAYSMSVKTLAANNRFEIRYSIPENTSIKMGVYDITGKVVREISKEKEAGVYSETINMTGIPTGVYFVRMEANGIGFSAADKFVLIK